MSESNRLRASATREGGVDLARCTNLQKHRWSIALNMQPGGLWDQSAATWKADHISWSAMNFAQKIGSPIGAHRSTKFGVLDLFICTGKEFKLHLLKAHTLGLS